MVPQISVLIVDDDLYQRGSLSVLLEHEGYSVKAVNNGQTALTLLEKRQFDIVLADIKMPGMTGMQLLKEIKEKDLKSEVILITAYGEIRDAVDAIKLGAIA